MALPLQADKPQFGEEQTSDGKPLGKMSITNPAEDNEENIGDIFSAPEGGRLRRHFISAHTYDIEFFSALGSGIRMKAPERT